MIKSLFLQTTVILKNLRHKKGRRHTRGNHISSMLNEYGTGTLERSSHKKTDPISPERQEKQMKH